MTSVDEVQDEVERILRRCSVDELGEVAEFVRVEIAWIAKNAGIAEFEVFVDTNGIKRKRCSFINSLAFLPFLWKKCICQS